MKIHEYQAKAILAKYDVPVPRGEIAFTVDEVETAAKKIGGSVVVKAQIHAGGRGKGGGVKVAKDAAEAAEFAKKMLGMKLVTHQTGPEGRIVQRLLVEETLPIERELYLGIVLDRGQAKPVFMASAAGGMEIEEVAAKTPELILKEALEPGYGLAAFQGRNLAFGMGIPAASVNAAVAAMSALAKAYQANDASLAEINPFILTKDGKSLRAGCQDHPRRQRAVSPQGPGGVARFERGRSFGSGGVAIQSELHQAGREHRMHGEWRGSRDGHHGHSQIRGRESGEFSGCGRRRQCRTDQERVPHFAFRPRA